MPRADGLIYKDCLLILPSHLDGIEAKHICIAFAQRYVGKQVDVAQLPGVQVVHEAAQSKDVAFFIIALVRGHLRSHTQTVSNGRPLRLQFLVPDTRGPAELGEPGPSHLNLTLLPLQRRAYANYLVSERPGHADCLPGHEHAR